jgi:subtilisin-like proprotein convertase family protein
MHRRVPIASAAIALFALVSGLTPAAAQQLASARPNAAGEGAGASFCSTPNVPIPDNNPAGVTDTLIVAQSLTIDDLDVYIRANHTWVGDVGFTLSNGTTTVTLVNRPGNPTSTFGCSGDNYDVTVDDEGASPAIENQCNATPPAIAGNAPGGDPANTSLLAAYDGQSSLGSWTLTATDAAGGDTGTLLEWCLVVASDTPVATPDIDVDPLSLANTQAPDVVAQLALTIGNNGDGDLAWTIGEEQAAPDAPVSFVVDDGVGENAIGLTNGGQFLWLNRFTPAAAFFPIQINQVQVNFSYPGGSTGVNVGELVDIYLYEDADGNPANGATFVASLLNQTVQAVDGTTWSVYNFGAPVTFNGPGDILIAVVNRTAGIAAGTFPAVLDQTASQQRSWAGFGAVPANPPVLPPPTFGTIDSFGFPGNWLVRGFGETNAPCIAPADVPWLSVSPAAGTTAPAASTPVAVGLDSTGLAPGIYVANLCVESDDPTPGPGNGTDLVVVPVELTVTEDTGPGPSVLEIPTLGTVGASLLGLALAGLGLGALRRRRS